MNGVRGEALLTVDGQGRRLCLTLGALAEIETLFGCRTLSELEARMRALSAVDLLRVVAALLRGGGDGEAAERLAAADISPGEAARAVAEAFRLGLSG